MIGSDWTNFWVAQNGSGVFHYNLFSLNETGCSVYLGLHSQHLRVVAGGIIKSTPECPLPLNSRVSLSDKQAGTLYIDTDAPVKKCGQFNVVYLRQPTYQAGY